MFHTSSLTTSLPPLTSLTYTSLPPLTTSLEEPDVASKINHAVKSPESVRESLASVQQFDRKHWEIVHEDQGMLLLCIIIMYMCIVLQMIFWKTF